MQKNLTGRDEAAIDTRVGGRLHVQRKRCDLSLGKVSMLTGITSFRLNEIETGSGYSASNLECQKLAKVYNLSYEKLRNWYLGEEIE